MADQTLAQSSALNREFGPKGERQTTPLVSVIITTRNRLQILQTAIRSVYAQDYPELEVLVADDGSEDGTSDFLRTHYPDIRLFRFEQSRGLIAARNLLMSEAKGDYLISLDDDAYLLDADTISNVVSRMEVEPELGVVAFRILDSDEEKAGEVATERYTYSYVGCAHCIRKTVLGETGHYREIALRQAEESDLSLRILDKGYRLVYFPKATVVHKPFLPQDRDPAAILTLNVRNRLLHAWLNEPFPWWTLSTANALVKYTILYAIRGGVWDVLRGFWQAAMDIPRLMASRRPVSLRAMRLRLALERRAIRSLPAIQALYRRPPGFFELLRSQ